MMWLGWLGAWMVGSTAMAAPSCSSVESTIRRVESLSGDALVDAFKLVARCDAARAQGAFPAFMRRATDEPTLHKLAEEAVRVGQVDAVWEMMEATPYAFREGVAAHVGSQCASEPDAFVSFFLASHARLRGSQFSSWARGLESCQHERFDSWLEDRVKSPPQSPYNETYNTVLSAYVERLGPQALPVLGEAAVAAAAAGPFNTVLEWMGRSIEDDRSPEAQEALVTTLANLGETLPPDKTAVVSSRLFSAGHEAQAAALLPRMYPDRVAGSGELRWVAYAVEQCDGEAAVHWVSWTEEPKRLNLQGPVEGALRGVEARLKCSAEGPWPVVVSSEPVANEAAAEAFVEEKVGALSAQGIRAKAREAKKLSIP